MNPAAYARILAAPRFVFLSLLAALVAPWMMPRANASGQVPRIDGPASQVVQAGDEATVSLDGSLPADLLPSAKIGDHEVDVVRISTEDRTEMKVRVPKDLVAKGKPESDYWLTFSARDGQETVELGGRSALTVYPRGSAQVKSVNDLDGQDNVLPSIYPNETFTVKGSGLFAPEDEIKFFVMCEGGPYLADTTSVAEDGTSFTAIFKTGDGGLKPEALPPGPWPYEITVWGRAAGKPQNGQLWIENPAMVSKPLFTLLALGPVVLSVFVVYLLSLGIRRLQPDSATLADGTANVPRNGLQTLLDVLLVDPTTNTYSLSRLQFLLWLLALVFAYSFVFVARGWVANVWNFPKFSGSELAFLISLGTLVGSVATTTIVGPKGAGEVRPAARDLIVHGGVVALDRVQQLIWTFVAIGILISIVYGTCGTTQDLPKISPDLLGLMGASSIGYLAGKVARKPGPIINRVSRDKDGLHVSGMNLGVGARVFINGTEHPKASITSERPGQTKPEDLTDALVLRLKQADKYAGKVSVRVVNLDGQEAQREDQL